MNNRKRDKKVARRARIKRGVRAKLSGTKGRPRLSVYRSNKHIYAQLIDDLDGHTLVAASSVEDEAEGKRRDVSHMVGKRLAERAQENGISSAVFDRNGYKYHGRVQALAEGAREGGLQL